MKILVAGWDSGGGVEAVQTVVRRAVVQGHEVRVLGTEACGPGSNPRALHSAGISTLPTTTCGGRRRTWSKTGTPAIR